MVNPLLKNAIKDHIQKLSSVLKNTTETISRICKSILNTFNNPWTKYYDNFGGETTSKDIGKSTIQVCC